MEILMYIFRGCLLVFMLAGYFNFSNKFLKINRHFSPIFTLSTLTLVLFFGGLIGQLLVTFYMLAFLGIVAGFYLLHNVYKNGIYLPDFNLTNIFILFGLLIFGGQLLSSELMHYDNFSHWLVIVKEMLIYNGFPTTENILVEFTNYPLGTASFIYFVCKVAGNQQSTMLIAQAMIIFSCFAAVFGIIRDKNRFLLTLILGTGCATLTFYNVSIRINNLLVDFLLPILTMAIIAVIYTYKRNLAKAFVIITPIMGFLVIVKSTGAIYAVIGALYLFYTMLKYRKDYWEVSGTKSWKQSVILLLQPISCLIFSFLPMILWNLHVDRVFAGVVNKFEVDASIVNGGFGGKTIDEVCEICRLFGSALMDFSLRPIQGFVLYTAVTVIACIVGCVILKKRWRLPKVLGGSLIILFLYCGGILAMYIFSMPLDEAIYLAGFDRYMSSIIVLYGGALFMCLTVDIQESFYYKYGEVDDIVSFKSINTKTIYLYSAVVCAMIIFMILSSEYNGIAYNNELYEESLPAKVQTIVGDNWDKELSEERYLIYASDIDAQVSNYYVYYVAKYYLRTDAIETICLFYEDNLLNLLSQYDYLVILESDRDAQRLMEKYFHVSGEEGIYATAELLEQVY